MNIGADSSRFARDEWGRELASGRCLTSSQDSVGFLAGWSVAFPCERNRVLGVVGHFIVLYFFCCLLFARFGVIWF